MFSYILFTSIWIYKGHLKLTLGRTFYLPSSTKLIQGTPPPMFTISINGMSFILLTQAKVNEIILDSFLWRYLQKKNVLLFYEISRTVNLRYKIQGHTFHISLTFLPFLLCKYYQKMQGQELGYCIQKVWFWSEKHWWQGRDWQGLGSAPGKPSISMGAIFHQLKCQNEGRDG